MALGARLKELQKREAASSLQQLDARARSLTEVGWFQLLLEAPDERLRALQRDLGSVDRALGPIRHRDLAARFDRLEARVQDLEVNLVARASAARRDARNLGSATLLVLLLAGLGWRTWQRGCYTWWGA